MRAQDRTEMKPYERDKLGPRPLVGPHNNEAIRMCVTAWNDLDADRPTGFGPPGPIPYTAIVTWSRVNRLDRDTFDMLRETLHFLDGERAAREASKAKTKGKAKK